MNGSSGHDLIDLSGRGLNFASLTIASLGGDTVQLSGVSADQIDAEDFLF